jgi:phage terminase large subunit GpA-like protein
VWASEDQAVTHDGRIVGPLRKAKRIGFLLPSIYSPWVTFSKLAAEWIMAEDDLEELADFINQRLAEPFEEQRAKLTPSVIEAKIAGAPEPLVVPGWAKALIATADTQGTNDQDGHFYYVVRAWDYGFRSQLVDYGVVSSRAELVQRCLERQFPIGKGEHAPRVCPTVLLVDSGGPRWAEVYELAQSDPRIHPTKGASRPLTWMMEEKPQKTHRVVLWRIDTDQSKDKLNQLITASDVGLWQVNSAVNQDYCRQMCSEAKIWDRSEKRERWIEVVKKYNHFWDCEHQQVAAAWRLGFGAAPPPEEKTEEPPLPDKTAAESYATRYKGRWSGQR